MKGSKEDKSERIARRIEKKNCGKNGGMTIHENVEMQTTQRTRKGRGRCRNFLYDKIDKYRD